LAGDQRKRYHQAYECRFCRNKVGQKFKLRHYPRREAVVDCSLLERLARASRRPPVKTNPLSRAAWFSRPRGRSAAVSSDRRAVGSWGSAGWGSCRSRLRPGSVRCSDT
jgi:hypothetical protein